MRRGWPFMQSLTAQDPSNTQWQRDLSVSYNKIGDVERQAGNLGAARGAYGGGHGHSSLSRRKTLAIRNGSAFVCFL